MGKNSGFFEAKQPPAELKHAILVRYPAVFTAKVGSKADRVVLLDGYAGPGRYEDGKPGSPLLLMQHARAFSSRCEVTGLFVERHKKSATKLRAELAAVANGLAHEVIDQDLGDALPHVLDRATGAALFAFLDPFGSAIAFEQIVEVMNRHRATRFWPPTEVLLHFSVTAVFRNGGALRGQNKDDDPLSGDSEAKLSRVDRFLGGDWWHERFIETANFETAGFAAMDVAHDFAEQVEQRTGYTSVTMPVYSSTSALIPKYVLLLFTRHPHGVWHFADVLGRAQQDWEQACGEFEDSKKEQQSGMTPLPGLEARSLFDEKKYRDSVERRCVPLIANNIRELLSRLGSFRIIDHVRDVYGASLGLARAPHVRLAVKDLHTARLVSHNGKGEFHTALMRRP